MLLCGALGLSLLLTGYAHGAIGNPVRGSTAVGADPLVPANIRHGGPVVAVGARSAAAMSMPAKTIALTFDDGPDPRWTPQILALLQRFGAHATFFETGARAAEHPALVREVLRTGNAVGTEGYSPADLGIAGWGDDLDLTLAQNAFAGAAGMHTRLLRLPQLPPQSDLSAAEWQTVQAAGRDGYLVVFRGADTRDWSLLGVDSIIRRALPAGHRGGVVTMQDGGVSGQQTLAALAQLLTRLRGQGYQFTTVTGGLGFPSADTPAGGGSRSLGGALVLAEHVASGVVRILIIVMVLTGVLSVLRLLVLVGCARVHRRRTRRARSRRITSSVPFRGPISVIVPAFNEAAGVAATLLSLCEARYLSEVEILVIDDGSTDRTAEIAFNLGIPGIRVISQPNSGKSAALNTGIALASHDIVVLVDGDTVFEKTALERLVVPFSDPEVAAVSGNTKVGNRRGLLGRWQHIEYVIGFNLDRRMYDLLGCMPTIPGAIGAFRRDTLNRVGGLSADTLAEDTDLTMTICRAGYRVLYVEDARAWTEAPSSLRQLWKQRYRWSYGTLQAMWKHRDAIGESGQGRKLGSCLIYILLFQVILPLFAPLIDVFAVYGMFVFDLRTTLSTWLAFNVLQLVTAGYAFRLDRESLWPLWALPLQQVLFRQLLYLVGIQSVVTALLGTRLGWQSIRRTGAFSAGITTGQRPSRRSLPAGVAR